MKVLKFATLLIFIFLCFTACKSNNYSPKPNAYFRIEFPEKKYQEFNSNAPFTFEYPTYSVLDKDVNAEKQPFWYNMRFNQFNGFLHLTYYDMNNKTKFNNLVEDARSLAFKHTIKASAIDQKLIHYPDKKLYGVYYAIEGNTASWVQFFLTDSAKHYFRGALYFNEKPQYDSIAPVVQFIKKDIDHFIESFRWKN